MVAEVIEIAIDRFAVCFGAEHITKVVKGSRYEKQLLLGFMHYIFHLQAFCLGRIWHNRER